MAKGTATAILLALGLVSGVVLAFPLPARAANPSFDLYGSMIEGWGLSTTSMSNPGPDLFVYQGDTVTITLHVADGMAHEFFVDLNGNDRPDAGEPASDAFSTTATVQFTATTAGTFEYYCYFHEGTMHGHFVVHSSGTGYSPTSGYGLSLDPLAIAGILAGIAAVVAIVVIVLRRKK